MKNYLSIFFISIILTATSCKPNPEEILKEKIENYILKKENATTGSILNDIIELNTIKKFSENDEINVQNNIAVLTKKNKHSILLGNDFRDLDKDIIFFDINKKNDLVLSNGFSASVYNDKKIEIFNTEFSNNQKVKLDSLIIENDKIYYFYKRNIYEMNITSGTEKQICPKKTFSPPFRNFSFNVNMEIFDNHLVVTTGIGGDYNLSVIDLKNNKCIINDKKSATGNFSIYNNKLHYIAGAAGNWQLMSVDILSNKKNTLIKFKNLEDICFGNNYIYYIKKESNCLYDPEMKNSKTLPQSIRPIKKAQNKLLISYENKKYLIDEGHFFKKLLEISNKIPEIMN